MGEGRAASRKTFLWLSIRAVFSLDSIEKGFMGIASPCPCIFPRDLPRYVFGRSSVDAYPDYDDAAVRQAVAVAGCVHIETTVRQVIDVCRWRMVSFVN